jgi:hypothetical protein
VCSPPRAWSTSSLRGCGEAESAVPDEAVLSTCGKGGKRGYYAQEEYETMVGDVDIEGKGAVKDSEGATRTEPATPRFPLVDISWERALKRTRRRWYWAVQPGGRGVHCLRGWGIEKGLRVCADKT